MSSLVREREEWGGRGMAGTESLYAEMEVCRTCLVGHDNKHRNDYEWQGPRTMSITGKELLLLGRQERQDRQLTLQIEISLPACWWHLCCWDERPRYSRSLCARVSKASWREASCGALCRAALDVSQTWSLTAVNDSRTSQDTARRLVKTPRPLVDTATWPALKVTQ